MKNNKIKYKTLLNYIVDYLNELYPYENYQLLKWYEMWETDEDEYVIHFVIARDKNNNDLEYQMIKGYSKDNCEVNEYFRKNNIVYCSNLYKCDLDSKNFYKSYLNDYIDLDDASSYFEFIDSDLLNNVIAYIEENNNNSLIKTLFQKYH